MGRMEHLKKRAYGRKPSVKRDIDRSNNRENIQITLKDFIRLEERVASNELQNVLLRFVSFLDRRGFDIVFKK